MRLTKGIWMLETLEHYIEMLFSNRKHRQIGILFIMAVLVIINYTIHLEDNIVHEIGNISYSQELSTFNITSVVPNGNQVNVNELGLQNNTNGKRNMKSSFPRHNKSSTTLPTHGTVSPKTFAKASDVPTIRVQGADCHQIFQGNQNATKQAKLYEKSKKFERLTVKSYIAMTDNCTDFKTRRKYIKGL